ncbi:hypothetical protein SAMN05421823_106118 [Catalinimonas alkaloidigena]|uniref:Uncharacterized protein n=2 Tax=Catalinimonas alkaloidigena TaxID=1075417 RepID=A0A1G9KD13_9BACT|nr:hypothetical protein SAMN05421823_106118 [Catalinimonas alkaloidigena]
MYNMMGYYVQFHLRHLTLAHELTQAIDAGQIPDSELLVFKSPVPLYHQIDKDFARAEGNFEYQGQFYEMVKWKLENDTIYTYCLTDARKAQLYQELARHVRTQGLDLAHRKGGSSEVILLSFLKEYLPLRTMPLQFRRPVDEALPTATCHVQSPLSPALSIPTPPPKRA